MVDTLIQLGSYNCNCLKKISSYIENRLHIGTGKLILDNAVLGQIYKCMIVLIKQEKCTKKPTKK